MSRDEVIAKLGWPVSEFDEAGQGAEAGSRSHTLNYGEPDSIVDLTVRFRDDRLIEARSTRFRFSWVDDEREVLFKVTADGDRVESPEFERHLCRTATN